MKIAFVIPFSLERLTGTPLRAKTTMSAVAGFPSSQVTAITAAGIHFDPKVKLNVVGSGKLGQFTFKVLRELRKIKPDVVHGFTTVSIIPMLLYKCFFSPSTKVIFEMHGWAWYETEFRLSYPKRTIFWFLDMLGLWTANVVIPVSNTEKEFLKKRTPRNSRVQTVWDPVDFLADDKPLPVNSVLKVGYIGNSERWQGLEHIVAAAKMLEGNANISFELAGFKSDDATKFPKLKNIKYVGRVERKNIISFLSGCDILVSSRLKEPVSDLQFPHKLSEYMAVGRAVIVSKASDQPFVVEQGKCGYILPEVSGEAIADAIKKFAALSKDEQLQLGKNAKIFCKNNLYVTVFAEKLKTIYTSFVR